MTDGIGERRPSRCCATTRTAVREIAGRPRPSTEALTEVRLHGTPGSGEVEEVVKDLAEVQQKFTVSGEPDALIHHRVEDVGNSRRVVDGMHPTGKSPGQEPDRHGVLSA
jgi:DNA-binding Lrp family transcriptional regulator